MRVAIVGGGYAGLASAFKISKIAKSISIFDRYSVGVGGASAVSAGLLHPLSPKGNLLWRGSQGFESTLDLLKIASKDCNVYNKVNLLRPLIGEKQQTIWTKAIQKTPTWVEPVTLSEYVQQTGINHLNPSILGAVRIKNALVVDSPLYLQSLWRIISSNSTVETSWHVTDDVDVKLLSNQFDTVILACGAGIDKLWSSAYSHTTVDDDSTSLDNNPNGISTRQTGNVPRLDLTLNESRNLMFRANNQNEESLLKDGVGVLCGEYVVHRTVNGQQVVLVGAAHKKLSFECYNHSMDNLSLIASEEQHTQTKSELSAFQAMVSAKLHLSLQHLTPIDSSCGVKVLTPRSLAGRLPFVGRHPHLRNLWMVAGFGSRGLIHHGTAAEILTEAILCGDEMVIPSELSVKYRVINDIK